MLVANSPSQNRIEAARDLPGDSYTCPVCHGQVVLKRGRIVIPHFAHLPNSECAVSAPESIHHLTAKGFLVRQLRALDCRAEPEYVQPGRRVDVAVWIPEKNGGLVAIAIEIQDSKITVDEMKARQELDRQAGFLTTVWVFTSKRAKAILAAGRDALCNEARIPEEMRYVANRDKHGVTIVDGQKEWLARAQFETVTRPGESYEWYNHNGQLEGETYPDRTLRATKSVRLLPCIPQLVGVRVQDRGGRARTSATFALHPLVAPI